MLKSRLQQLMFDWQAANGEKLTMRRLRDATGLSLGVLDRMKSGELDRIHAATITALCKFFACNVGDLLEYVPGEEGQQA